MRKTVAVVTVLVLLFLFFPLAVASAEPERRTYRGEEVASFRTGKYFTLMLTESGELWAWGDNRYGQLGTGDTKSSDIPVFVMDGVVSAAAGWWSGYALTEDGSVYAWGNNELGQLGLGDYDMRLSPTKVLDGAKSVAAALNRAYALGEDGKLYAWGNSSYNYPDGERLGNLPRAVAENVDGVICGSTTTLIFRGGMLLGWGGGLRNSLVDYKLVETRVSASATGAAVMGDLIFYIDRSGDLWQYNQGMKNRIHRGVAAVSASDTHFLALDRSGDVWAWGANSSGELGNGGKSRVNSPVRVLNDAKCIAAGSGFSLASKLGGGVWGWGDNSYGQIAGGIDRFLYNVPHVAVRGAAELPQSSSGDYKIILNGELLRFDVQPINRGGRLIAPVRAIFERFGEVEWDAAAKTVTMNYAGSEISLKIGSNTALVNGAKIALDTPAEIISSRTFVPVRFVCEMLGAEVNYDPSERAADIFIAPQSIELTDEMKQHMLDANVRFEVTLENGVGTASGVAVNEAGLVLTNRHVVEDALAITLVASDGRRSNNYEVWYVDDDLDYAIIKTDLTFAAAARPGRSGALRVGDKVAVCGCFTQSAAEVRSTAVSQLGSALGGSFLCSATAVAGTSGGGVYSASGLVGIVWSGIGGKTAAIPIASIADKLLLAEEYYRLR